VSRSLILDFDASVRPLPDAGIVPLGGSQEAIRFGCRMAVLRALGRQLAPVLDAQSPAAVFLGSGDYHHVSYLLIERLRSLGERLQIVVFDNHPDNMRYPFGIHCGSWVWHVSRLPFVARVHVVGITSNDVEGGHLWENHLLPLYSGKVRYWCVQRKLRSMRTLGIRDSRSFASMASLLDAFSDAMTASVEPIYLTIDKDVLAADVVSTNWDQGVMRLEELTSAIRLLRDRLVGSDVTGDVSSYRYRSRFKRLLSGLDRQPPIPDDLLEAWQTRHQEVNRELLSVLGSSVDDAGQD
jgi:arginase family enzyme